MNGHLLDVKLFSAGLRIPIGYEIGVKLVEEVGILEGEDGGASAEPVFEGIEAPNGFSLGGLRTGGMLRILAVGFELFGGNHRGVCSDLRVRR